MSSNYYDSLSCPNPENSQDSNTIFQTSNMSQATNNISVPTIPSLFPEDTGLNSITNIINHQKNANQMADKTKDKETANKTCIHGSAYLAPEITTYDTV
jgi:hypothetical protein